MLTKEEATVYAKELDSFVTVKLLEDTPAVLSLGKLCEDHGYIEVSVPFLCSSTSSFRALQRLGSVALASSESSSSCSSSSKSSILSNWARLCSSLASRFRFFLRCDCARDASSQIHPSFHVRVNFSTLHIFSGLCGEAEQSFLSKPSDLSVGFLQIVGEEWKIPSLQYLLVDLHW